MAMAKALEKARLAAASMASAAASIAAIARGRHLPSSEPRRSPFPKVLDASGEGEEEREAAVSHWISLHAGAWAGLA